MEKTRHIAQRIREVLGEEWIPTIYARDVLTDRTRRYPLRCPQGARHVEIRTTLWGLEVAVDGRRLLVPDLAVARYLALFARIGIEHVAIPYDITRIARIADRLERAWHELERAIEQMAAERSALFRARVRSHLLRQMQEELDALGAGAPYPSFEMRR